MPSRANSSISVASSVSSLRSLRVSEEVRIKGPRRSPVRQVLQPDPGLVEQHLVKLAGHRRLRDAVAAKVANGAAQLAQADPLKIGTMAGQVRIGMVSPPRQIHVVALPLERLGDHQRIAAPAGDQADAGESRAVLVSG